MKGDKIQSPCFVQSLSVSQIKWLSSKDYIFLRKKLPLCVSTGSLSRLSFSGKLVTQKGTKGAVALEDNVDLANLDK